jgi:Carboxypeptidase regulatory-like domain
MKFAAILPALALAAGIVCAQAPAAKPGSIEGVVTNSVTNELVKKAVVTLEGGNQQTNRTTMTDAVGHFLFDGLTPGAYLVSAERDGFLGSRDGQRPHPQPITVAEEQQVHDVALKLVPVASINGHVVDEDGDPIAQPQVVVLRYFYGQGPKRLLPVTFAQTNDLGEFNASNLSPGRYYVQVLASAQQNVPPRTRWTRPEQAYPRIFYPNASDAGQAAAIDVAAGGHVSNIDFRLHKVPAYHIRGTAGDTAPGAGVNGRVQVEADSVNIAGAALQSDGSFDVRGLVNGAYTLMYIHFGGGKPPDVQTVRVSDADVNGVVLDRKAAVNLSGAVTVEGSQPEKLEVNVFLSSFAPGEGKSGGNSPVGADGKFVIADLAPDIHQVQVSNVPPGKYVKSIRFGDREINSGEIDLTNSPSATLNIVLGADGGEVDGMVQTANGQPAAAQVTLAAAEEFDLRQDLFKIAITDSAGNFQIKDVAPGEYRVFAWESDPEGSIRSAEFRKPFESRSVAVTVGPNEKASVQLSVITAEDVEKERGRLP